MSARGRWWKSVGDRLRCGRCRKGPPICDRCEATAAESVCAVGTGFGDLVPGADHLHLCGGCRDQLHRRSGMPRLELGGLV